jgi:hypothetical protein
VDPSVVDTTGASFTGVTKRPRLLGTETAPLESVTVKRSVRGSADGSSDEFS